MSNLDAWTGDDGYFDNDHDNDDDENDDLSPLK